MLCDRAGQIIPDFLPMKVRLLILVVALGANAALVAAVLSRGDTMPVQFRSWFETKAAREKREAEAARLEAARAAKRAEVEAARIAAEKKIWRKLNTSDLHQLIARLRTAGFPDATIRAIVQMELLYRQAPRLKELSAQAYAGPYWKTEGGASGQMERFAELSAAYRELWKTAQALLADAGLKDQGRNGRSLRYGSLAPDKVQLVQQIESDYMEMSQRLRASFGGVMLPEDQEKLALLEREKNADLAGVMSPEELASYSMRTSEVTRRLKPALTILDATEAEYRAIYAVMSASSDALFLSQNNGIPSADWSRNRVDALTKAYQQLEGVLSPQRLEEFKRANTSEYQQLYPAARRENISAQAINRVFALRDEAVVKSFDIQNNLELTRQQKREQIKQLAQTTEREITGLVGPNVSKTYVATSVWLRMMNNGTAVTIRADGSAVAARVNTPSTKR